jgi:hypothetical protein
VSGRPVSIADHLWWKLREMAVLLAIAERSCCIFGRRSRAASGALPVAADGTWITVGCHGTQEVSLSRSQACGPSGALGIVRWHVAAAHHVPEPARGTGQNVDPSAVQQPLHQGGAVFFCGSRSGWAGEQQEPRELVGNEGDVQISTLRTGDYFLWPLAADWCSIFPFGPVHLIHWAVRPGVRRFLSVAPGPSCRRRRKQHKATPTGANRASARPKNILLKVAV